MGWNKVSSFYKQKVELSRVVTVTFLLSGSVTQRAVGEETISDGFLPTRALRWFLAFPSGTYSEPAPCSPLCGWQMARPTSRKPFTEIAAPLPELRPLCSTYQCTWGGIACKWLQEPDKQCGCYSIEGQQASAVMIVKYWSDWWGCPEANKKVRNIHWFAKPSGKNLKTDEEVGIWRILSRRILSRTIKKLWAKTFAK